MREYCVYMMANKTNTTLYVGVTNNLQRRIAEHKSDAIKGFTSRYKLHKLVYFEVTNDISAAIQREKQIKAGSREKKNQLVNNLNPDWRDLAEDLY